MALYKCPECGHTVSDKADACPNCGCKIGHIIKRYSKSPSPEKPNNDRNLTIIILALCALIVALALIAFLLYKAKMKNNSDPTPTEITAVTDSIAQDTIRLDSIKTIPDSTTIKKNEADRNKQIKDTYISFLKKQKKEEYPEYALFDITGDGLPEIWITKLINEGPALYSYKIEGNKFVKIYEREECNTSLDGIYKGNNYIVTKWIQMDFGYVYKIFYQNGKVVEKEVFSSGWLGPDLDENTDNDAYSHEGDPKYDYWKVKFKEPEIPFYSITDFSPIHKAFN